MKYYIGRTISTDDYVFGHLEYYEKENQFYIVEIEDEQLSWAVDEDSIEIVLFEVNTVSKKGYGIETSNTFEDYDDAMEFYKSISDDECKELLLVNEDGYIERILDCNY